MKWVSQYIAAFFFLIQLFIFHSIFFLKQLHVQKVYTCHSYTLKKGLHTVMYAIT